MSQRGKILVLAYPDTFVRMSDEWQCRVLPKLGLGTSDYIKAGHAALVLIDDETQEANYYDFGRYVTPNGKGRVRSALTDVELRLPFRADLVSGELKNLEEFMVWLSTNPKKTHGEGRLLASVCDNVDINKARRFVLDLQAKGSIRYGAFAKEASNCARFVTDTILASTSNRKIISALKRNKSFTPSGVGNVEKAASTYIYQVLDGQVDYYKGSVLKENLTNYFDKRVPTNGHSAPKELPEQVQTLTGIGSDAHFLLQKHAQGYTIRRYNHFGERDFEGIFNVDDPSLDLQRPYQFAYDSHCLYCHIEQDGKRYRLEFQKEIEMPSSVQKVRTT